MQGRVPGALIAVIVLILIALAIALYPAARDALRIASPSRYHYYYPSPPSQVDYTTTIRTTKTSTFMDMEVTNNEGTAATVTIREARLNDVEPKTKLPMTVSVPSKSKKTVAIDFGDPRVASFGSTQTESVEYRVGSGGSGGASRSMGGSSDVSLGYRLGAAGRGSLELYLTNHYSAVDMEITISKIIVNGKRAKVKTPISGKAPPDKSFTSPPVMLPKSLAGKTVAVEAHYRYRLNPLAPERRRVETLSVEVP